MVGLVFRAANQFCGSALDVFYILLQRFQDTFNYTLLYNLFGEPLVVQAGCLFLQSPYLMLHYQTAYIYQKYKAIMIMFGKSSPSKYRLGKINWNSSLAFKENFEREIIPFFVVKISLLSNFYTYILINIVKFSKISLIFQFHLNFPIFTQHCNYTIFCSEMQAYRFFCNNA